MDRITFQIISLRIFFDKRAAGLESLFEGEKLA